jgi:hypothetical protein
MLSKSGLVIAVLVALATSAGASAQSTSGAPASNALPAAPPSPQKQAAEAESIVGSGQRLSQRVTAMLSQARRENDIIKVTCLSDKLTQINANLRGAQQRLSALKTAVDVDRRNHEYTVLTVLDQKFQVLDQEANQCVGQDMFEAGTTKVETDVDTELLPFDETGSVPPTIVPPGGSADVPPPATDLGDGK